MMLSMRITLTLLIAASLGCERKAETPAQTDHTTIDIDATSPQTPSEQQLQHRPASGSGPDSAIPGSAQTGQAEQIGKTSSVQSSDPPPRGSETPTKPRSSYDVAVVDEGGNPIKHATVEPISLSINYPKFDADENGHANIPWKLQPVKWIAITKPGYVDSGHIDVDQPKPIIVTLKKATD